MKRPGLRNISIFWYSFLVLSLHTHANRELKVLTDYTGGLGEIYSSDKTSRLEGQLRTGKQFHAELPKVPRRDASTSATSFTTTAQPLVIGQAGSAQLMAISLSASFPGFTSAHEMNRWLDAVALRGLFFWGLFSLFFCFSNTGNEPHQKEIDVKPHYGRLQKSFYNKKKLLKKYFFSLGTMNLSNLDKKRSSF